MHILKNLNKKYEFNRKHIKHSNKIAFLHAIGLRQHQEFLTHELKTKQLNNK